jgi:hypothetical protein
MYKKIIRKFFNFIGYELIHKNQYNSSQFKNEPHLDKDFIEICEKLQKIYKDDELFIETNYTAYLSVKNIISQKLPGGIVECGVFQGVKCSIFIETLKLNNYYKNIYLVDTFSGMTQPSYEDFQVITGSRLQYGDTKCNIDDVKKNIFISNYPKEKIFFIQLDVRNTSKLSESINENIALLRIDTDFYDSVLSVLKSLSDKVVKGGYIIHDDYGHWSGHYKAFKDFNKKRNVSFLRTARKEIVQIIF